MAQFKANLTTGLETTWPNVGLGPGVHLKNTQSACVSAQDLEELKGWKGNYNMIKPHGDASFSLSVLSSFMHMQTKEVG